METGKPDDDTSIQETGSLSSSGVAGNPGGAEPPGLHLIPRGSDEAEALDWGTVPAVRIACYPWDESGYRPEAEAVLCWTPRALHLRMRAFEAEPLARFRNFNDPVYRDSCLECFLQPAPERDGRYFNFELNALGTILIGLGHDRHGRIRLGEDDRQALGIRAGSGTEGRGGEARRYWEVGLQIPIAMLGRWIGPCTFGSGSKMRGNFYLCGDETPQPHYGCWNPVHALQPDFHRPEYFGDLVLA